MILKTTQYKNNLKNNEILLYINTTGINQNSNHIFLVNILDGKSNRIYQFLSENNKDEEHTIKNILPYIKGKNIISYNGKSFDINFINKKIIQYNIDSIPIKSFCDIYVFLKDFPYIDINSKKIDNVYNHFFKKNNFNHLSNKEFIQLYKSLNINTDVKNILFKQSMDNLIKRYMIFNSINNIILHNTKSIDIYGNLIRYYLYKIKFEKNYIIIQINIIDYDNLFEIDFIDKNSHIYSKNGFIFIKKSIVNGFLSQKDIGICVIDHYDKNYYNPFTNLKKDLIPIIINEDTILKNIEQLIYSNLKKI